MECLFCKMVRGEIIVEKIYEDVDTMAFLDANPSAPGHTLVIPKQHKENILDLSEHEITSIFTTVKKVVEMIKRGLNPKGFNIGINHGLIAGARVPHLHIHIIPRFEGDKGGVMQAVVNNPPKEDLASIAAKIRGNYEIPDYLEEQDEKLSKVENKEEVQEEKKNEKEEKAEEYLEDREKDLFPPIKRKEEKVEEKEEEDIYEKMLKNMRIPK